MAQNIHTGIQKGYTEYVVEDIRNLDEVGIRAAYKEVLKPLVKDPTLLNLLTLESNLELLKNRFEYRAYLHDSDKNLIVEPIKVGERSLRQVVDDLQRTFKVGMSFGEVSSGMKWLSDNLNYASQYGTSKNPLGYINLKIVFRKGR